MPGAVTGLAAVALGVFAAASAAAQPCMPRHSDGVWQPLNAYSAIDEAREFSQKAYSPAEARAKLGEPAWTRRDGKGSSYSYWLRGEWRESRFVGCDGEKRTTYTVAYAVLRISYAGKAQTDCHVIERIFISGEKRPSPLTATQGLMRSSQRSCASFWRTYAEEVP